MDTNQITRFDFHGANVRLLTDEQGEPWFVAKDICDVLELTNVGEALRALDDDEKNTIRIYEGTAGNPYKATISESGFYRLVLRSRKPVAKEFQRWSRTRCCRRSGARAATSRSATRTMRS